MKYLILSLGLLVSPLIVEPICWGDEQERPPRKTKGSTIKSDEEIIFFPTAAYLSRSAKEWRVPVHGWIFEPEEDDFLRNKFRELLRREIGEITDPRSLKRFDKRIQWFLADNESGKRIAYRIANRTAVTAASQGDGHFVGLISIPVEDVKTPGNTGWLEFKAELSKRDQRQFIGRAQLLSPQGWLVISDIDDTVKISEVTDKRKLIRRTFLQEFEAVRGMSELYQNWATTGAAFRFVSSSPWQLYPAISKFLKDSKFPLASFSLKQVRIKGESIKKLVGDPFESKVATIKSIIKRFPERKIVLVGDSGEKDPEVYGEIARQFPKQIERIFVRNVTDEKSTAQRFKIAFRNVDSTIWQLFVRPQEIEWTPRPIEK